MPPESQINKDFLKEVLSEQKTLLRLNQVKRIYVPLYDELAVLKLWPMMQSDEQLMRHFPSKMARGRVPDREYFFNVVNTFHPEYLQQLIKHAQEQRHAGTGEARVNEAIQVSDGWWDALTAVPYISRKCKPISAVTDCDDHSC